MHADREPHQKIRQSLGPQSFQTKMWLVKTFKIGEVNFFLFLDCISEVSAA